MHIKKLLICFFTINLMKTTMYASSSVASSLVGSLSRSSSRSSTEGRNALSYKDLIPFTISDKHRRLEHLQNIADQKNVALAQIAREQEDIAQVTRNLNLQLESEKVSKSKIAFIELWMQQCDAENRKRDLWLSQLFATAEHNEATMQVARLTQELVEEK